MASVIWCDNEECEYCDRSGFCTREVITIDEYGVCVWSDAKSEHDIEFWQLMRNPFTKECFRRKAFGRKVVIDGVTFYTTSSAKENEDSITLTEAKTGCLCGNMTTVKARLTTIKHSIEKHRDVMSYPVIEETR